MQTINYHNFNLILESIYRKSPLQEKKIKKYLLTRDDKFFENAEEIMVALLAYLKSRNIDIEYAVDAYLALCSNMIKAQVKFMRTGRYPVELAEDVYQAVYDNEAEMEPYMIGLAISLFLWNTHYDIFRFYESQIKQYRDTIHSYLEVGPGHGLFLSKALHYLRDTTRISAIDISATALNISKSLLGWFWKEKVIAYYNDNIFNYETQDKYDFIIAGEVLEHVNLPDRLLAKLKDLLTKDGKIFISTCVNCPAIDHVYHFRAVEEIRDMVKSQGLHIIREIVLPVEDLPWEQIVNQKVTINYSAILD